ncbi:MAG: HK97-gp10 family putative phage morphogenesis protein [Phycisphaerae bacterium]
MQGGSMSATIQIINEKAIVDALGRMDKVARGRILRTALRAAARPIRETARSLVPVKSGDLRKSIRVKAAKRSSGSISFLIDTNFYGEFVEYGHIIGKRLKGRFSSKETYKAAGLAKGRTFVEAKPFLRPAFDQHEASSKAAASKIILDAVQGVKA